jgi:hypothetical protein
MVAGHAEVSMIVNDHLLSRGREPRPRFYHPEQEFVRPGRGILARGRICDRIGRVMFSKALLLRAIPGRTCVLSIRWLRVRAPSPSLKTTSDN